MVAHWPLGTGRGACLHFLIPSREGATLDSWNSWYRRVQSIQLRGNGRAHVVWRPTVLRRSTEAKFGELSPYPWYSGVLQCQPPAATCEGWQVWRPRSILGIHGLSSTYTDSYDLFVISYVLTDSVFTRLSTMDTHGHFSYILDFSGSSTLVTC